MSSRETRERQSLTPKVEVTPEIRERILDRKAKGDAVDAIRRALGSTGPGIRKIYYIIAEARALHDPRAGDKPPQGRPPGKSTPPPPPKRPNRAAGEPLEGWWFGAETIVVTRLGFGSADCLRVPVSVSCVPTKKAPPRATGEATCVVSVCRSLAEAMALHPLHGARQDAGGQSRTEPVGPRPQR